MRSKRERLSPLSTLKEIVHPKCNILSSFAHPTVPNLCEFLICDINVVSQNVSSSQFRSPFTSIAYFSLQWTWMVTVAVILLNISFLWGLFSELTASFTFYCFKRTDIVCHKNSVHYSGVWKWALVGWINKRSDQYGRHIDQNKMAEQEHSWQSLQAFVDRGLLVTR